jgi:hypothetical protein
MKEFVKLNLAETDWTFRALDLDQIEQLEPQFIVVATLAGATTTMPKEGLAAVAEIACESLRFKHPDITVAQCRKLITIGTMQAVVEAVRGVSSLEPKPGEA